MSPCKVGKATYILNPQLKMFLSRLDTIYIVNGRCLYKLGNPGHSTVPISAFHWCQNMSCLYKYKFQEVPQKPNRVVIAVIIIVIYTHKQALIFVRLLLWRLQLIFWIATENNSNSSYLSHAPFHFQSCIPGIYSSAASLSLFENLQSNK